MTENNPLNNTQITFIGGGNMAQAIIAGLQANATAMQNILVVEPDATKRTLLSARYNVNTCATIAEINTDDKLHNAVIVLAVKPQHLAAVCTNLQSKLSNQLIISIAAGVSTTLLARWLNSYKNIVRVMPNTPAQIQAGISAMFALDCVLAENRALADAILQATGATLWLDDETKMDAVTAISGSGPAYVFYLIEALAAAGVRLGLTTEEAKHLAIATFAGASQLAQQSAIDVVTLRAQVTSKGGTTEQGVMELDKANVKDIFFKVAHAAAQKSIALGQTLSEQ